MMLMCDAALVPSAGNTLVSAACHRHTCSTALTPIPTCTPTQPPTCTSPPPHPPATCHLPRCTYEHALLPTPLTNPLTPTALPPGQIHPEVPFVDSSPSNGLEASAPYVKRWGDSSDARFGDVHYYNYRDDCQDHVRGWGGWRRTAVYCGVLLHSAACAAFKLSAVLACMHANAFQLHTGAAAGQHDQQQLPHPGCNCVTPSATCLLPRRPSTLVPSLCQSLASRASPAGASSRGSPRQRTGALTAP